jgi:hypothetical protein
LSFIIQRMAACANGIARGKWLVAGSGLRFVEWATDPKSGNYNPSVKQGEKRGMMIYGVRSIIGPLQAANDAASIKMPQ